jgi:type I restriction enzyme, S subunit
MKIYAKYKDSGVNWIGDIPEGWGVVRIKIIAKILNGSTPKDKAEFWDGEIKWITPTDIGKIKNEKFIHSTFRTITKIGLKSCGCELCPPNSIVITNRGPIGNVIIPTFEYATNQGCKALLPTQMHNNFFLFYQLKSWSAELENLGQGTTFKELSTTSLKNFIITSPPLKEQEQIVAYLDEKTSHIDKLLDISKRKIGLLKEQRSSIINQVITKGLNPNAKMKHSGVEWIGDIPEGWLLVRTNKIFKYLNSGLTPSSEKEEYYENGIFHWITTTDLNETLILDTLKKITEKAKYDYPSLNYYPKGSIFISMYGGKIGKIGISNFNSYCNQSVCVLPNQDEIVIKYYYYWFLSFQENLKILGRGGGQPNINKDMIKEFPVIKLSINEQEQIVAYLDEKTSTIDKSISIEERRIGLLKEYRQSIISQVITGKIKVIADE